MKYTLYIGGYAKNGISRVALQDGRLTLADQFPAPNASYLYQSPDGKRLYAVGETQRFRSEYGGSVSGFAIEDGGRLTLASTQPTRGSDPCHLTVIGDLLLVSNYTSGSLSRFRLEPDGTIGEMLPLIEHRGSGRKPDRQSGPHIHQASLTPNGWVAVSDLGLDKIVFYPAPEIAVDQPSSVSVSTPAGFGPRHCLFPRGRDTWYVLCELESQLLIYRGAPTQATLIGRVPIGDSSAENLPAALRLSPDGKMIAATGRGQNVISLFSIGDNGMLARLTEVSSRGDWPRDVQFSPDGKYLVCANQRSNTVTAFAIEGGHLEYRSSVSVTAPACALFSKMQED